MEKVRNLMAMALALSLLAGCGGGFTVPKRPTETEQAQESRAPIEVEQVTGAELSLRLLESECAQYPGKNVILSPLSIEMALAMAANGADGEAEEAVKTLLGMEISDMNALLSAYLKKEDGTLSIANSMWFNQNLSGMVGKAFKRVLEENYRAGEGFFAPHSGEDADEINRWVSEKTNGKIDGIIDANSLTENTLALLINALYFNGKWVDPFKEYQVSEGKFHAADGDQDAQLMSERLGVYFESQGFTGFSKPYRDGYEFIGILPDEEGPADLSKLDIEAFLKSETRAYDVDIRLPKFELEYGASLKETLCGLGLQSLFEDGGMNGVLTEAARAEGGSAYISDVVHKTYMKMYEAGTEAAAVTAVIVYARAAMPEEKEVKEVFLDRPFAFLIRDTASGQIIFCGAVNTVE